jgi:hypothetical protein
MVWARMYWNNPQQALNPGPSVKYLGLPFNWYDFNSKQTIKYYGAFSQTRLWDDRLNITLGMRRDSYDVFKVGIRPDIAHNTPVLGNGAGNTYSVGAIGYITDWLGAFVNVSDNYQPAAGGLAPSLFGVTRGASFGKGENAGLRVSTKDGKYYASVTFYKDTAQTVLGGNDPGFQNIWSDYFNAGGTATDLGPAGQVTGTVGHYSAQMQYNTTYDVEFKGVEFEVTANPTKNLRLQLHYSSPKGQRTNNGTEAVAYFNQHLAEWQTVAGPSTSFTQKVASDITNAQKSFAVAAIPTLAAGVPKDQFNAFVTYSFTEDTLKGLDIGFGATEEGARQLDQVNRTPAYTTYSMLVGYSTSFVAMDHKLHTRFQLNVDNLFGNDTLVFQGYNGTTGMDYNFIPPRKLTFSVKFDL